MSVIYLNDNEPFVGQWLAQLVAAGELPECDLDVRSIKEIRHEELSGYTQCHFFAGIGGWPLALKMAGWPDDRSVWTGSCPCQPFSVAGKRQGESDERHLWPDFLNLIAQRRPSVVFGEQVASKAGREWLARVRLDMETLGYAFGAADLCAAGVSAPHIRQRLYWVADADGGLASDGNLQRSWQHGQQQADSRFGGRVAYAECNTRGARWPAAEPSEGAGAPSERASSESGRRGDTGGLAHSSSSELAKRSEQPTWEELAAVERSSVASLWGNTWAECADGKARRIEPSIFPLAYGVPNRVGSLRGSGNAAVPQIAAQFIGAYLDA